LGASPALRAGDRAIRSNSSTPAGARTPQSGAGHRPSGIFGGAKNSGAHKPLGLAGRSAVFPLLSLARMKIRILADFHRTGFSLRENSWGLSQPASLPAPAPPGNGIRAVFGLRSFAGQNSLGFSQPASGPSGLCCKESDNTHLHTEMGASGPSDLCCKEIDYTHLHTEMGASGPSGLYGKEMVVQRRLRRLAYQTFQVCTVG
jgi:hypothetical protein